MYNEASSSPRRGVPALFPKPTLPFTIPPTSPQANM
jgi:hypothetical protein